LTRRLEGKRTIITGAASGIGRASVLRFVEEGARVLAADLAESALEETIRLAKERGGDVVPVLLDVGDEAAVAGVVEQAREAWGGLDAFFANAGISGPAAPFWEITAEQWMEVLRVDLVGPFLAVKYAAPAIREAGGGAIICTPSAAGLRSGAGSTPYSAAKAGVVSLVQTCCQQLTGSGVRVNAICPGLTETGMTMPMYDAARAAGKEHKIGQLNPLQRGGEPVEIANAAVFLASDESSYINGQAIAVDGGLSSSHPFVPGRMA